MGKNMTSDHNTCRVLRTRFYLAVCFDNTCQQPVRYFMKHSVLKAIIGSKPLGVKNIFEYFALSSTCDEFFNSKGRVFLKPKECLSSPV